MCFGDFLGKRTPCDACHKEHASYYPAFLDISETTCVGKDPFSMPFCIPFSFFSQTVRLGRARENPARIIRLQRCANNKLFRGN